MQIVTLISDWKLNDYYIGAVKGALLKVDKSIQIVDIAHELKPHDIYQTAILLKNSYYHFPEKTIHLICVSNFERKKTPIYVAVEIENQIFIGPDNGVFSLISNSKPTSIYEITNLTKGHQTIFPEIDIYMPVVKAVIKDKSLTNTGNPRTQIEEKNILQPYNEGQKIIAHITYIDSYGNLITNILKEWFEKHRINREFDIIFRHDKYAISKISKHYNEVPDLERVALFGKSGYLEIALNKGNAAEMFGLKIGSSLSIVFHEAFQMS